MHFVKLVQRNTAQKTVQMHKNKMQTSQNKKSMAGKKQYECSTGAVNGNPRKHKSGD
jgi:hypothetical protein